MGEWSTALEKHFLDGLATGRWFDQGIRDIDPIKVLEGYIRSCKRRYNWDDISRVVVENYAKELLYKLKGGG
jgi:hypothetical protein